MIMTSSDDAFRTRKWVNLPYTLLGLEIDSKGSINRSMIGWTAESNMEVRGPGSGEGCDVTLPRTASSGLL